MKKLVLSIITLGLVIVTLTSTTFAWFLLNRTVSVDNLELNVTSGNNILLSVDGSHWYQHLNNDQIKKAIVKNYKGYNFYDEKLYDEDGTLISDELVNRYFSEIALAPITSFDGKEFSDIYGTNIGSELGKHLVFDLYFTAETDALAADTDIFFYHGIDKELPDGTVVKKTSIASVSKDITLRNSLTTYNHSNGEAITYDAIANDGSKNSIKVNPGNALRFSVLNVGDDTTKIYELDSYDILDDGSLVVNSGLGSYATDYTSYDASGNSSYMAMYDSSKNAGFTYYNNLKDEDLTPLDYYSIPNTIKNFDTYDNALICNLNEGNNYIAHTKFAFYIEGWDADCFDGIGDSKTVINLTFSSSTELDYDPVKVSFYDELGGEAKYVYEKANPTRFLELYKGSKVDGKVFKGWKFILPDETISEEYCVQYMKIDTILETYYTKSTEEIKLIGIYE